MEILTPTAVVLGNLSGSAADLDDSPDAPDDSWCTGSVSEPLYAIEFPSNGDTPSAFVAMQFANPHGNGLPIWGPDNAGVTYIWRVRPVQHTGYYTTFFWANNGTFLWDSGSPNTYYGCHPYPDGGASGTTHYWEISIEGGDTTTTRDTTNEAVVKDQWYTQACRVIHNGGTKTLIYYFDLPSTANAKVIEHTTAAGYGNSNPPSPALTFGDAPWNYPNERLSGQLGQVKIIAKALSEADMLDEAADMSQLVTTDGQNAIWWGKKGFADIDDLTCDYGTERSFAWADGSNKAALGDAL